jgi:hypothetical protein
MQIFDDFYHHRLDLGKINYGVITLIPKGENANIIKKFRPICLLQVDGTVMMVPENLMGRVDEVK